MESNQVAYTIGGVNVLFPWKAYPSQLSMMNKIIKGVQRCQNCLLESPTGSGKSLALLCSALAWQKSEAEKRMAMLNTKETPIYEQGDAKQICTCTCANVAAIKIPDTPTKYSPSVSKKPASSSSSKYFADEEKPDTTVKEEGFQQSNNADKVVIQIEDDDFQPSKKRYRTPTVHQSNKRSRFIKGVVYEDEELEDKDEPQEATRNPHTDDHWKMQLAAAVAKDVAMAKDAAMGSSVPDHNPVLNKQGDCMCCCHQESCNGQEQANNERPNRVPKIYFGTRTHKQITQIVKELGRTAYNETHMTILGSREHLCVHPRVSIGPKKNEGCKDLLKRKYGESCKYYSNVHRMKSQWQLQSHGLGVAWDIEDLVTVGKKVRACPYFAVRGLVKEADIVFCPYNYLIDPKIRNSMDIVLKDQIVILDEAHNMEDSCREAASLTVTADQFTDGIAEFDKLIAEKWRASHSIFMHVILANLLKWIESSASTLTRCDFESESRIWTGVEMVAILNSVGINPESLPQLQHHLTGLMEEADPKDTKDAAHTLSSTTASLIEGLLIIFRYLFQNGMCFMKDYKIALMRTISRKPFTSQKGWISRRKSTQNTFTLSLNFWCLNPAVAFSDLLDIRTIVLTSGTLSPMDSFSSELGTEFPIQLEANHVIHKSQIFASTVAFGPNGHSLNASYKSAESYSFQDDVGQLLLHVCQIIPYGVLMFLPSYNMMSKLEDRWKNTGLWDKLNEVKVILSEPRGNDKNKFDLLLIEFYDIIKDCEERQAVKDVDDTTTTGAVFLAVCRGKVSEGMDFTDNNARAVLTVGIPFPSFKDKQVELKRQYNDKHSAVKGLLTGSAWYEIQAYRALNQALGRCIRHKNDWGALILVDERYGRNPSKYISGLSKWIRNSVMHIKHASEICKLLEEFVKERKENNLQDESLCTSMLTSTPMILGQKSSGANSTEANSTLHTHNKHPTSHDQRDQCSTPYTSHVTNSISRPGEPLSFKALQQLLRVKSPESSTNCQSPNTLHQPVVPVDMPIIVSTEAVGKLFQVQQFLREHDGQLREVKQLVKLAPYQALVKTAENGLEKLLVIDKPKPDCFITNSNNEQKHSNETNQISPTSCPSKTLQTLTNVVQSTHNASSVMTSSTNTFQSNQSHNASSVMTSSTNTFQSNQSHHAAGASNPNEAHISHLSSHHPRGHDTDTGVEIKKNQIMLPQTTKICCIKDNKLSTPKMKYTEESNRTTAYVQYDQIQDSCEPTNLFKFVTLPGKIDHKFIEECVGECITRIEPNGDDNVDMVKPIDDGDIDGSPLIFEGTPELFDTDSMLSDNEGKKAMNNEMCEDEKCYSNEGNVGYSYPMKTKLFKPRNLKENTTKNENNNDDCVGKMDEQKEYVEIERQILCRKSRNSKKRSTNVDDEQKKETDKMRDILEYLESPSRRENIQPIQCSDDIQCSEHGQCSEDIQCSRRHRLLSTTEGLEVIPLDEIRQKYVKECCQSLGLSSTNKRQCNKEHPCCINDKLPDHYALTGQLACSQMTGLTIGQPQHSLFGILLNSYWCEADQTCYQPLFCCQCSKESSETSVVGLQEKRNTVKFGSINIWLFPKNLNFCQYIFSQRRKKAHSPCL